MKTVALLTEDDVVNKTFSDTKNRQIGYNQDEVDDFLDEVAESIKELTDERDSLRAELDAARARIGELEAAQTENASAPAQAASFTEAPAEGGDQSGSAAGVLALAQRLHDEYVNNGREEGDRIVAEANAESTRIIRDAEEQHSRTINQLEQERSVLEHKISELRDFERDYRARLKSYLESLLGNVESGQSAGNL